MSIKKWLTHRRARYAATIRTQEMLLAKEVEFRRRTGMKVPNYLLPPRAN
jgi:hypothetical protein